jgi:hypothetical protein
VNTRKRYLGDTRIPVEVEQEMQPPVVLPGWGKFIAALPVM